MPTSAERDPDGSAILDSALHTAGEARTKGLSACRRPRGNRKRSPEADRHADLRDKEGAARRTPPSPARGRVDSLLVDRSTRPPSFDETQKVRIT